MHVVTIPLMKMVVTEMVTKTAPIHLTRILNQI